MKYNLIMVDYQIALIFDGDSFMYHNSFYSPDKFQGILWQSQNERYLIYALFEKIPVKRGICKIGFKAFNTRVLSTIKKDRLIPLAVKI